MKTTMSRLLSVGALPFMGCLFVLAVLIFAGPAHGDSVAYVELNVEHVDDWYGNRDTTTESDFSDVGAGTVSRAINPPMEVCDMTASATATTGSAGTAGALARIDVSPDSSRIVDYLDDLYLAEAKGVYVVPWIIEHPDLPVGSEVDASVRLSIEGQMRIDFLSGDQYNYWYYTEGDFISPLNYEGLVDTIRLEATPTLLFVDTAADYVEELFYMDAAVDSMDEYNRGLSISRSSLENPSKYFTDISFIGPNKTDPAALAYSFAMNVRLTPEDYVFHVGDVFDLALELETSATLLGTPFYLGEPFELMLTSDFLDTASYTLESLTEGVTFRALVGEPPAPVPEPATMLLLGSGLIFLAAFRRRFRKG